MKDIKMRDVFGREVRFDAYNVTLVDPVDYGEWAEFNSEDSLVAAAHAINSHDSLVEQLAAAKAEIAEYRDALDKLLDEARSSADQVHHEFGLGEQVYDESITNAEKLLAKHKGE